MNAPPNGERRPGGGGAQTPAKQSAPIVSQASAFAPARARVAERAQAPGHVIRLVTTLSSGHLRTVYYSNLPAAVRAHDRALSRGCVAVLSLCRVDPVGLVTESELADLREVVA